MLPERIPLFESNPRRLYFQHSRFLDQNGDLLEEAKQRRMRKSTITSALFVPSSTDEISGKPATGSRSCVAW